MLALRAAMLLLVVMLTSISAWADNVSYYDPTDTNNPTKEAVNPTAITSETVTLNEGWYHVSGEVTCDNRIEVIGTVNIILVDGGRLNANRGIHLTEGKTLNIYAQSAGSGYLYVKSIWQDNRTYNAIGGNSGEPASIPEDPGENGENAGDLNIYGGYIEADGQIGGGNGGNGFDETGLEDEYDENGEYLGQFEVLYAGGTGGDGGNGGTINIYGGNIHANDIVGAGTGGSCQGTSGDDGTATINLSWSKATDRIYIDCYLGTVTLLKEFTETNGEIYSADSQHNYGDGINGRTLMPSVGDSYSVTIAGGYDPSCLTANRTSAKEGVTITLTAVNHYVINSLTVKDASNQTVSTSGSGPWTFTMPGSDVTVTPTATRYYSITKDATVTLSADDSDKLQQSGHTYYRPGATISFILNIDEDKDLQSVSVTCNGQPVSYNKVSDTYTFSMQSGDVTITPTYETIGYTIGKQYYMTLSTASGNVTTRNGKDYYKAGAEITVTLDIPDCYSLDYFSVNNGNVEATDNHDGTWTFTMPEQRVTLSASYSIDPSAVLALGGTSDFTVTGGTSEYVSDEGYDKLLDGETSTNWHVYGDWNWYSGYACYVEFQTAAPVIPKGYMLTTASYDNFINCQSEYTPNAWTLQAKLDENDAWTTITDVSDGWLSDWENVTSTFNVENRDNNAYQYFRFEVKGTKGYDQEEYEVGMFHYPSDDMLLSEMQLLVKAETENITAKENDGLYWTTYYNGTKGYKIADGENACAYTATVSNSTITLHKLGKVIPAGTAVIIVGEDSQISMTASMAAAENTVGNNLHGVDVATTTESLKATYEADALLMLSNKNSNFGFHDFEATTVPARKAFLALSGSEAKVRSFTMVFEDETTAVCEKFFDERSDKAERRVKSEELATATGWFTLDGRRLSGKPTKKGMYLYNGKKLVIK